MTFETMNHTMNQHHHEIHNNKPAAPANNNNTIDLYVVQKCWFAGVHVPPAVDYSQLLVSLTDAEQVAYQSAHLYNRNGKRGVRTIQLQSNGVGYGFVADGMLFWVRKVRAACTISTAAVSSGTPRFGEAYGVVQEGILGGNPHARRTVNAADSDNAPVCCFVGPHSSHAAMKCLQEQLGHQQEGSRHQVQWFSVGTPASLEQLQQDWPDHAQWLQHSNQNTTNNSFRSVASDVDDNNTMAMDDVDGSERSSASKRGTENGTGLWFNNGSHCYAHNNNNLQHEPSAEFCGLTPPPPSKRACRVSSSSLNEIHHNGHFEYSNDATTATVSMME